MSTQTPSGLALVLIVAGIILALTASIAALISGHRLLMAVAAVGFALQIAGWATHGRRHGGAA
ncbi:hypothetical protein [Streptomyces sp. NPDC002779]|uniref:hypothetical protein n=1 Tax=Streptomyces sp. NPDC002779 TaxID=3364664 RepID=UPI0036C3037D